MSKPSQTYRFIFSGWTTFFTAIGLSIFLSLAFWQWHRGQEKEVLERLYNTRLHSAPLTFTELHAQKNPQFYLVSLKGYFDNNHPFILLSRFREHQVGIEILVPFLIKADKNKTILLVNRGWLKQPNNPNAIPNFPQLMGLQSITGIITIPEKNRWLQEASTSSWPKKIRTIDMERVQKTLGKQVYPYILLQTEPKIAPFNTDWVLSNTKSAKHFAYAVQWLLFATIALGIYLKFHIIKV